MAAPISTPNVAKLPEVTVTNWGKDNSHYSIPKGMQELIARWLTTLGLIQLYVGLKAVECLMKEMCHGTGEKNGTVRCIKPLPPGHVEIRAQAGNNTTNWKLMLPAPPRWTAENYYSHILKQVAARRAAALEVAVAHGLTTPIQKRLAEMTADMMDAFGQLQSRPIHNGRAQLSDPKNVRVKVDPKLVTKENYDGFVRLMVDAKVLRPIDDVVKPHWTGHEVFELYVKQYQEVFDLLTNLDDGQLPDDEVVVLTEELPPDAAEEVFGEITPVAPPTDPTWLTGELERLNKELEQYVAEQSATSQQLNTMSGKLTTVSSSLMEQQGEVAKLQDQVKALQTQIAEREAQIRSKEAERQGLQAEGAQLNVKMQELQLRIATVNSRIDELRQNKAKLAKAAELIGSLSEADRALLLGSLPKK